MSPAKRLLDVVASGAGLLVLSPLLLAVAIAIKLDDGGPVLFRHERVGRGGGTLRMWKFRTMVPDAGGRGRQLTVAGDDRITRVGAWLRRLKIDELPQLVNVLRGQMSLVGPRPEVPRYVALYPEGLRRVLDLTPGMTDPASIRYRRESELLASVPEPERIYVEAIIPDKLRINLEYADGATLLSDLGVIARTLWPWLGHSGTTSLSLNEETFPE